MFQTTEVNNSGNAWATGSYSYGISVTNAYFEPLYGVRQFVADEVEIARKNAVGSFWPKDRRWWLEEYDRLAALQKALNEEGVRVRQLESDLAKVREPATTPGVKNTHPVKQTRKRRK
jgi:hypothetical protein